MAVHNLIIASGSAAWAGASFDSGNLPANGDTVNFNFGSADINSGLAQSGVTLAALNILPGFSGTIGTTGNSGDFLAIGVTAALFNSGSGRIKINFGSVQTTIVITKTGPAIDTGQPALEILGTHASNKLYMATADNTSTVGVATRFGGETSTLAEWDVQGGSLTLGAGVTQTTGNQSGASTVTTNSAITTLTQSGRSCTLTTQGTGLVGTVTVTGTAYLNSRVSGDSFTQVNVGPSAIADFSTNPAPALVTNAIKVSAGGTVKTFSPAQVQLTGPAALQVKPQFCGVGDVNILVGEPVTVTVA